ncbi:acyltransferase family protein [Marinicrinis lubricantis]|uniref:Acyltransferase family protein n=1 Tax=Marinicrinis lubricantis TaxID=2086470 RepID=A0ABW1ILB0_9BACL
MLTNASDAQTRMYNLRSLLIFLVVTMNMLEPIAKNHESIGGIYTLVFTFHMPLFVFVTGYFAGKQALRNILPVIAYQYTVFQSLYCILDLIFFQMQKDVYSYFIPYAFLWFLFSHIGWRIMLHFIEKLNHPVAASIGIGLVSGFLPLHSMWMSLSQMLFFLPFYVIGHQMSCHPSSVNAFKSRAIRWTALPIMALGFAAVKLSFSFAVLSSLTGLDFYHEDHLSFASGIGLRSLTYMLEIFMSAAVLSLISHKKSRITDAGKRTLYVYLLHALIVRTLIRLHIFETFDTVLEWLSIPLIAAAIVALLSSRKVEFFLQHMMEPPFLKGPVLKNWLVKVKPH